MKFNAFYESRFTSLAGTVTAHKPERNDSIGKSLTCFSGVLFLRLGTELETVTTVTNLNCHFVLNAGDRLEISTDLTFYVSGNGDALYMELYK